MARWALKVETYTPRNCASRVEQLVTLEAGTWAQRYMTQKFKPRHQWSNGADKLFYDAAVEDVGYTSP